MAFWDQVGTADGSSRGNYFPPIDAEYDVQIEAVKHKIGHEGESVIVEMRVLTSNNPEIPPGTGKSTAWNLTKHKDMALNNIKSFVCGIYGMPDGDKSPAGSAKVTHISKRMVDADNPLMGAKVHLTTWKTKTRKGEDFTSMKWAPYTAEPGYVPPMPSAGGAAFAPPTGYVAPPPNGWPTPPPAAAPPPPPPPVAETYHPPGTTPGRGATHVLRGNQWVAL